MNYITETGAIISDTGKILSFIDGTPGSVEFPEEMIWKFHKDQPGKVFELAHTHPTGMTNMSSRDEKTLKTWAFALYPYPIRLSVITFLEDKQVFIKKLFFAKLEPKENWVARGKGIRNYEYILESQEEIWVQHAHEIKDTYWEHLLIRKSFELPIVNNV